MLGVIVNSIAIIAGGIVGLIINKGISERLNKIIMDGIALVVMYMGISGALKGDNALYVIISICVGGFIGELIDLDKLLNKLGEYIDEKLTKKNKEDKDNEKNSLSRGFVSASLLFCVGAMAVVGALNSGLFGNNDTLFAKSALDGVSSFLFSLTMGIGVLLSAVAVFLYEGIIACGAFLLKGVLSTAVITEMNAVGSLLILALGINMILKANIKVANLLPAMFVPIIFGIIGMI